MLSLITDAPAYVVREAVALVPGVITGDAAVALAPTWAVTVITAPPSDALAMALGALSRWRFEPWRPRPAIADPTFAMAAANVDRERSGGTPAPAQAWV